MNNVWEKILHFLSDNPQVLKAKKICKYCISGGTGSIIDFGLYSLIIYFFSTNYLVANLISFNCGTLATYLLQKNWTFRYKTSDNIAVFQRYIVAVIGTYILNNVLLFAFVDVLTINVFSAKILQIAISTVWGYSINSIYVFKEKKSDSNTIF